MFTFFFTYLRYQKAMVISFYNLRISLPLGRSEMAMQIYCVFINETHTRQKQNTKTVFMFYLRWVHFFHYTVIVFILVRIVKHK